jgi:hypothetical protein
MEIEKFFYFFERKAQLLRQPYTLHGLDVLLRVGAVSGRGTQSRLEQFSPLIKSDCPDFDARSLRQFSNLHAVSINSAPRYRLKKEVSRGWMKVQQRARIGRLVCTRGNADGRYLKTDEKVVRRVGIEPTTYGLRVHCSAN